MAKATVRLITKDEYLKYKSLTNRYEREFRKRNPAKHKRESRAFVKAIVKGQQKQK